MVLLLKIKKPDFLSGFFTYLMLWFDSCRTCMSIAIFSYYCLEHPALYVFMIWNSAGAVYWEIPSTFVRFSVQIRCKFICKNNGWSWKGYFGLLVEWFLGWIYAHTCYTDKRYSLIALTAQNKNIQSCTPMIHNGMK